MLKYTQKILLTTVQLLIRILEKKLIAEDERFYRSRAPNYT